MYKELLKAIERVTIFEEDKAAQVAKLKSMRKKAQTELKKYRSAGDKEMVARFKDEVEEIDKKLSEETTKVNEAKLDHEKLKKIAKEEFNNYLGEIHDAISEYGKDAFWEIDEFLPDAIELENEWIEGGLTKEEAYEVTNIMSALIKQYVKNKTKTR